MNQKLQDLMYHSGLTAHGCWDEMDEYDKQAIKKFAELIVRDCVTKCDEVQAMYGQYTFTARKCKEAITGHFGVKE